jgi:hypothetical protein
MADDTDYMALAREQLALEDAAATVARIQNKAAQMQHADERAALFAALRKKHGLPDTATPREVSDAWIAHRHARNSFVSSRFAGRATAAQILSPESAPEHLRSEFQARQDAMFAEFDKIYDAEVASRPPVLPGR